VNINFLLVSIAIITTTKIKIMYDFGLKAMVTNKAKEKINILFLLFNLFMIFQEDEITRKRPTKIKAFLIPKIKSENNIIIYTATRITGVLIKYKINCGRNPS
jgi:hypothetical protein